MNPDPNPAGRRGGQVVLEELTDRASCVPLKSLCCRTSCVELGWFDAKFQLLGCDPNCEVPALSGDLLALLTHKHEQS